MFLSVCISYFCISDKNTPKRYKGCISSPQKSYFRDVETLVWLKIHNRSCPPAGAIFRPQLIDYYARHMFKPIQDIKKEGIFSRMRSRRMPLRRYNGSGVSFPSEKMKCQRWISFESCHLLRRSSKWEKRLKKNRISPSLTRTHAHCYSFQIWFLGLHVFAAMWQHNYAKWLPAFVYVGLHKKSCAVTPGKNQHQT